MNPIATTLISQNAHQNMDSANQNMNSMPEFGEGGSTLTANQVLSIGIGIASFVALILTIKYYNKMLKKMAQDEQAQQQEIQQLQNIHPTEIKKTKQNFF